MVISSFELPEQSPETISNAGLFVRLYHRVDLCTFRCRVEITKFATRTKFSFAELNQLSIYFRTLKLEIYGHRISLKFTLDFVGD